MFRFISSRESFWTCPEISRLRVPELPRQREAADERGERDAAVRLVERLGVPVAQRVVELRLIGVDDHVVIGELTEVDARALDAQIEIVSLTGGMSLRDEVGQPLLE